MRRIYPIFEGFDVAFASVSTIYAEQVPQHRFYVVRNVSRLHRWGAPLLFCQLVNIILRERPDVVITTGAAPALFALTLAKLLLGAKTIWIDSVANVEKLSMSGTLAGAVADVWLTQWPAVSRIPGPAYWGAVL